MYNFGIVRPIQNFDFSARARLQVVLYHVRSRGAPWYVASGYSGETNQITALVLEMDTPRLQLQDPTAFTGTICCWEVVRGCSRIYKVVWRG